MEQSSISDNNLYPIFCYSASKNDEDFKNFKSNPVYRNILEHVSPEQGLKYLEIALSNAELHLSAKDWDYILKNDTIGNPLTAKYIINDSSLVCSPTTLRYVKVLSDIVKLFPKSIIGGGYAKLV